MAGEPFGYLIWGVHDKTHEFTNTKFNYKKDIKNEPVGTVTISGNNINRLFVLPEYQHKGYGKALLDFAEKKILESYECVQIDASLPAKQIYKKRGYKETEYNIIKTDNGDCLCYDVMRLEKKHG